MLQFIANCPYIYRSRDLRTTQSTHQLRDQTRNHPDLVVFLHRMGSRTDFQVIFRIMLTRA